MVSRKVNENKAGANPHREPTLQERKTKMKNKYKPRPTKVKNQKVTEHMNKMFDAWYAKKFG